MKLQPVEIYFDKNKGRGVNLPGCMAKPLCYLVKATFASHNFAGLGRGLLRFAAQGLKG